MRTPAILLFCLLCPVSELAAAQDVRQIAVGGDVPRPGPVHLNENGMTIQDAVAKAGLDLRQFHPKEKAEKQACPIRVMVHRDGTKKSYDPSIDVETLRSEQLRAGDALEIKDFRTCGLKIEERIKRIDRMIVLGSADVCDEIWELVALRHEHDRWRKGGGDVEAEPLDSLIRKEAVRLSGEGKREKTVALLELRKGALELDGLGPTHPSMRKTTGLIAAFKDLSPKSE